MSYREMRGLNQSSLKKILVSPQEYLKAINKQEDEATPEHFLFGTVVDIMLTGTKDEFDEKFVKIPDETKCSETIVAIVKDIFEDALTMSKEQEWDITALKDYDEIILKKARQAGYQNNWKDETLTNSIIKQGSEYFELLKTTVGKTPITESEYAKAVNAVMALKADKYTQMYTRKQKDVEYLDKFIVCFGYEGEEIKGELDRVVINHKTKTITPIDFKTTGKSMLGFNYDFWQFRYDFQAAVYTYGLQRHSDIINLLGQGYTLNNFLYIVVEKSLIYNPQIFEVHKAITKIGWEGGTLSNGRRLEGFVQAVQRYQFATKNDAWDYSQEYYENEGKLFIEV
jgi:hypothetical protein